MNTPIDIAALHESIRAAVQLHFPMAAVGFYPRPGEKVPSPSIFLELDDILVPDPDDMGTEQLPVVLNFNAYCVISYKSGNKLAVRTMAAALLTFVNNKRWGQPVSAASVAGAYPDQFSADNNEHEVMRVEFSHEAILGNDVWDSIGVIPSFVYLSQSPNVGPVHLTDYELITSPPP